MKTKKSVALLCACLVGVLGMVAGPAWAEPLSIVGFETGGGMAFEGATVSNYYTLEFAPTLLGPWTNWGSVCGQAITGTVMSLPSPFFYRIRQTDNSAFPPYAPASNIPGYMLANGAVTGDKIAAGTVDAGNLAASVSNTFVRKSGDTMSGALTLALPGGTAIQALGVDVNTFGTPENAKASSYLRLRDMGAGTAFRVRGDGCVGIGTGDPAERLEVAGRILLGGANGNLEGVNLSWLAISGKTLIGWNRSGGPGEADFISNRGAGSDGGFYFYDIDNAGTETKLLSIGGTGQVWIRDNLLVNGNVGIGTTSPQAKLDVNGSIKIPSDVNAGKLDIGGFGSYLARQASDGSTVLQTGQGGLLLNPTGGNVGIGTVNPAYPLVVQKRSAAAPALMIGGGYTGGPRLQTYGLDSDARAWMGLGSDMGGGPYEHSLYFPAGPSGSGFQSIGSYNGTNYSEKMRVTVGGKVGIGTTDTSAAMLTVAGTVKATGFIGDGSGLTNVNGSLVGAAWMVNGNMGMTTNNFLGTTDNAPLTLVANGRTALRLDADNEGNVNVIGGSYVNQVSPGIQGATIAGGGYVGPYFPPGPPLKEPNVVEADNGTISGGSSNRVGGVAGVVGGGEANTASQDYATVGGGVHNVANGMGAVVGGGGIWAGEFGNEYPGNEAIGMSATVGGGSGNLADAFSTVGGGNGNTAYGGDATVAGGHKNTASGSGATVAGGFRNGAYGSKSTIGGGAENLATNDYATVPGGFGAKANHYGQFAYASGMFGSPGSAQTAIYVLRNFTEGSPIVTNLYLDGKSALITVPIGASWVFDALVVGRMVSGHPDTDGRTGGWEIRGVIKNVEGTTSFVGTPSITTLGSDTNKLAATVMANDVADSLDIMVINGFSLSMDIGWVATVRTVEFMR